jgi:serine/threonine-protein kinase
MKLKAPLITLGAGLVVAGVLYGMNVSVTNEAARDKAATAAAPAASPSQAPAPAATSAQPSTPPPGDGTGNAAQQGTITYAGAVDGGAASLGVVVKNGKAIAYVCDGRAAESWMDGDMANGEAQLNSAKATGNLTATYTAAQMKGTVKAGTKTWTFTIKAVAPPSGLYRSQASLRKKLDASWIVLPDGKQVGVETRNGVLQPAPPFDVNSKTAVVDGTAVTIEPTSPATGY